MTAPRLPYVRAPDALRDRVRSALHEAAAAPAPRPGTMARRLALWRIVAIAACLALALIGVRGAVRLLRPDPDIALVDAHVRSLMAGHLTDVASSEHHTVKPWFAGKLDFSPPVPDLAADSFMLIGGRVDHVAGRTVAAVVYGRGKHIVTLFVWPTDAGSASPRLRTVRGINVLAWSAGDLRIVAVSDLNAEELRTLPQLFH